MKQSIPKIIHYCWFGENPLPEETQKHIATWRKVCPEYEIKEWNETNFDINAYEYTKEAHKARKWAFISDVCRLEKVYEHGGIYLDVNTDIIKSFNDLLENNLFIGFEQDNKVAAGVFGAKAKNSIVKSVLNIYKKERLVKQNGKMSFKTINDRFESELLKKGLIKDNSFQVKQDFTVYPKEWFHPRYWNSPKQDVITSNTHTVHYYGASWHDAEKRNLFNKLTSNQQPLVSVIVPIYNVELYIQQCVDSILRQTYENIEIILVDDKTPDRSNEIADDYAGRDNRVKVIHKQVNEGLNMARATGFKASSGDYVMFVDSDDIITDDCIEKSLLELYESDVDFVKFNFAKFKDEKTLLDAKRDLDIQNKKVTIKTKRDLFATRFTDSVVGASTICVWGGLYPSAIIRELDWTESNYRINEDNFWTLQLFEYVNSGLYVSRVGYLYRSDDSYQGVLSKATVGNSLNGNSVGYLEFVKKYFDKFYYYNAKYKLELNKEIELLEAWMWIDRLINVSQNNLLEKENNREFLPIALAYLVRDYKDKKSLNNDRKEQLKKLKLENDQLRREIKTFHSIQRSARLLAGNMVRKIKSITANKL